MSELLKYDLGYTKYNVQKSRSCLEKAERYLLQLTEENNDKEIEEMYVTLKRIRENINQWLDDNKLS